LKATDFVKMLFSQVMFCETTTLTIEKNVEKYFKPLENHLMSNLMALLCWALAEQSSKPTDIFCNVVA